MHRFFSILLMGASACSGYSVHGQWSQFRGEGGSGIAAGKAPPVHFGPSENIAWKTEVPTGHSSPCIWDDRVFLTGVSANRSLQTICLRRDDGHILWERTAPIDQLEEAAPATSGNANPASSTPCTDGTNVCVYFGSYGLIGYDLEGNQKWQRPLPMPKTDFGTGTSPILSRGRLILNRDQNGDSFLVALDPKTGEQLWKTERPFAVRGFSTPLSAVHDGIDEIIVAGNVQLAAYDLKEGSLRWFVRGLASFDVCPSPVTHDGLIFAAGVSNEGASSKLPSYSDVLSQLDQNKDGKLQVDELPKILKAYGQTFDADKNGEISSTEWENVVSFFAKGENVILAVRPDGPGDRTGSAIVWRQRRGVPRVASPLYYEERLYVIKDGGLLSCFRGRDGKPLYELERLGAEGEYFSSPVAAGGCLYFCSKRGVVVVIKAGDKLKVLARNTIGEPIYATPAIIDETLYVRTSERLYAFR